MTHFEILTHYNKRGLSDPDALALMGILKVGETPQQLKDRQAKILGCHLLEALLYTLESDQLKLTKVGQ